MQTIDFLVMLCRNIILIVDFQSHEPSYEKKLRKRLRNLTPAGRSLHILVANR